MTKDQDVNKNKYVRPSIERIGSFEAVTKAGGGSTSIDQSFPAGTPFGDLTFS